MFIRKLKNRSGSISIQIISKSGGKYRVVKSFGSAKSDKRINVLYEQARQYLKDLEGKQDLFHHKDDIAIEAFIGSLSNAEIQVIGPELIFGKIYDAIGFGSVDEQLFRHLVLTRLFHPGSKLKAIDYLRRFQGIEIKVDAIYRFLDKLSGSLKTQVEHIAYEHVKTILGNRISIVFYDMTTLHFESSDEDDLRRTGFSKVGKHQNPQIYLGLLVGIGGYALGYDIFEGNTFEGHTLIPFLQKFEQRFETAKPIVVADAGLLTNDNLTLLQAQEYQYVIGARIKNENKEIKENILSIKWKEHKIQTFHKGDKQRLVVSYSEKRATKDAHNRKRGLQRLEKKIKNNKLTKSNINNRGYNKYLKLVGKVHIHIDYEKYEADSQWDGLKGYITNSRLKPTLIIENYNQLWQIEKAFRISKTDLKIRPIFHRLRNRIEAHICISFTAYCIYKELERVLIKEEKPISLKRAAEITYNMYQIKTKLPHSRQTKSIILKMSDQQKLLYDIIQKYY